MWTDTRYLFLLIRFNVLSRSRLLTFQQPLFLAESGCKDTTIFQTGKIFFSLFPEEKFQLAVNATVADEKKFHHSAKGGCSEWAKSRHIGQEKGKIGQSRREKGKNRNKKLNNSDLNRLRSLRSLRSLRALGRV